MLRIPCWNGKNCHLIERIMTEVYCLVAKTLEVNTDISWNCATIFRYEEQSIAELISIPYEYVTTSLCGKVDDNLLISYYSEGVNTYYSFDITSSSEVCYEIKTPENANYMRLLKDELDNVYYYANNRLYCRNNYGYQLLNEIPQGGSIIGVIKGYVLYRVYNNGEKSKIFQIPLKQ